MRWLFVLLLAFNIGFFAWQMNRERRAAPMAAVEPAPEGERLLLLREAAGPPAAAIAMTCFSVGPFADRAEARRIGEWFKTAGVQTRLRVAELPAAAPDTQLMARPDVGAEFWLDVTAGGEAPPTPMWDRVAREHPELRRIERRCRQIAPDQAIP